MRNRNTTANDNRVNGGNSKANGTNTYGANTNDTGDQNPNITERNRANSQHSTGPRTDESKAASAQNALRDEKSGTGILSSSCPSFQSSTGSKLMQKFLAELVSF